MQHLSHFYPNAIVNKNLCVMQEVCRLYRKSLKLLSSWTIDRNVWLDEAEMIRNQFDQNAALRADSGRAKFLLRKAHEKMAEYTHPDPYVVNYMPGSTLYMRNPPLPLSVCYPNGIPEEVQKEVR
jgi:NADH dehydrogenase (ubiquinone) 1 beta subcomplex subunit 9